LSETLRSGTISQWPFLELAENYLVPRPYGLPVSISAVAYDVSEPVGHQQLFQRGPDGTPPWRAATPRGGQFSVAPGGYVSMAPDTRTSPPSSLAVVRTRSRSAPRLPGSRPSISVGLPLGLRRYLTGPRGSLLVMIVAMVLRVGVSADDG
jgi:hypothetical protein